MKIVHILPRGMKFNFHEATSIDLFVAEIVQESQYCSSTHIIGDVGILQPLLPNVIPLLKSSGRLRKYEIYEKILQVNPDIIFVQQHVPTAIFLSRRLSIPIVVQRHNYVKNYHGLLAGMKNFKRNNQFNKLSGIFFVSEALRRGFQETWPKVKILLEVLPNGASFDDKNINLKTNNKKILFVGRAVPEKGVVPALEAVLSILNENPEWSADFVLSSLDQHEEYLAQIAGLINKRNDRLNIHYDISHEAVRQLSFDATIALVPSIWKEPFGRTALEAHVAKNAVISSGRGGLKEISGDWAIYVDEVTTEELSRKLQQLIDDPDQRDKISIQGFERARTLFRIQEVAKKYDGLILDVLKNK